MNDLNKNNINTNKLNLFSKARLLLVTAVGTALLPFSFAQAAMVTFSDFAHLGSDSVDYIVTIKDDAEAGVSVGHFKISYQVDPLSSSTTAKFTGFFFDANNAYTAANLGLSNQSVASCDLGFNTHHTNGSCGSNLNLGANAEAFQGHDWDVGITWKNNNDLSGGQVESFEIAALSLSVNDINNIGLRGQNTSGSGGSAKEFQSAATVVPVPTTAYLFLSGLAGLCIIKQRK